MNLYFMKGKQEHTSAKSKTLIVTILSKMNNLAKFHRDYIIFVILRIKITFPSKLSLKTGIKSLFL